MPDMHKGRNLIINGDFNAQQRGVNATALTNGQYSFADRWVTVYVMGTMVTNFGRSSEVPDSSTTYSHTIVPTTIEAAIADSEYFIFEQRIEGWTAQQLAFGTPEAKTTTLSFWVRGNKTGIYCANLVNSAGNRGISSEYTIDVADAWEKKVITFPGDITGTWLVEGNIGLRLRFGLAAGADKQVSAADTWEAANAVGTANQVNFFDDVNNEIRWSQVQLEVGDVATDFERISLAETLRECYYYYERQNYSTNDIVGSGCSQGSTTLAQITHYWQPKRIEPAVSSSGDGTNWTVFQNNGLKSISAIAFALHSQEPFNKCRWSATCAAMSAANVGCLILSEDASTFLEIDAEL